MSELRWNPFLGEWIATATKRQDRTFLPPTDYCPLCPTKPDGFPTEVPSSDYDIVVFENRFPSLSSNPDTPVIESSDLYPVRPSQGVCEVILYSPNHQSSLAQEPIEQIYKLVLVWSDRFHQLSAIDFVKYVFIFENKGEAIGVTLHHPHGQIYAYPFIPPRIETELDRFSQHHQATGRCLLCEALAKELDEAHRIVAENDSFVALIPFFARWPYETHVYSKRHFQALTDMTGKETRDLASILKMVLVAFDKLFELSFPYIMAMHQRPVDGRSYEFYHFHIEFYPPLRSRNRLKYLAGSETGAGMFINDTLPEEKAAELRAHVRDVIWEGQDSKEDG